MDQPNAVKVTKMLSELNLDVISPSTVRRRLNEDNIHGRAPFIKPILVTRHLKARLAFALKYQSWTVTDWKKALFTDESKLNKMGIDGKT